MLEDFDDYEESTESASATETGSETETESESESSSESESDNDEDKIPVKRTQRKRIPKRNPKEKLFLLGLIYLRVHLPMQGVISILKRLQKPASKS